MNKLYFFLIFMLSFQWAYTQADGAFKEFYDNNQLKIEGHYKDNRPAGEWKEYHPNGQLSGVYSYTDGKLNKKKIYYFESGRISSETEKVGNDYVRKSYFESGNLFYEWRLKDGYYKEYFESGELAIESNYVNEELSGIWRQFYKTGALEWTVNYKNDYREGIYQNFYNNGQLKLEGKMLKDKKNGEEKRYLENGQLEWTGKYKSDKFDKYWERHDAVGEVSQKIKFENGLNRSSDSDINLVPTRVPDGLLERVPVYPGCEALISNKQRKKCMNENMSQFIASNFNVNFPKIFGLEGRHRINVIFKIGVDGEVSNINAKTQHPALKQEAFRVINLLPKMQPGLQRGKPVIVPYALPIVFQIPEITNNTRK